MFLLKKAARGPRKRTRQPPRQTLAAPDGWAGLEALTRLVDPLDGAVGRNHRCKAEENTAEAGHDGAGAHGYGDTIRGPTGEHKADEKHDGEGGQQLHCAASR